MNTTIEIDKAGRIVVPKKVRDRLHLTPGTRLTMSEEGEALIFRQEPSPNGLYKKCGLWVHGGPSTLSINEVRASIEAGREQREYTVINKNATS